MRVKPIFKLSVIVALIGLCIALSAFILVLPYVYLVSASIAAIAGMNSWYAWRYE